MKKTSIIAQGHCGLNVELNLMDQYAITHAIERMEEHNRQVAEHNEWEQEKKDKFPYPWKEECKEPFKLWKDEHPEPTVDPWIWEEEIAPIYVFLRKLRLPQESKATVFDEEEEK